MNEGGGEQEVATAAPVMDDTGIMRGKEDLRAKVFCYRDSSAVVQSGLSRYFNQRTFSDLTVVAPNGQKVLCHQVVLSAGSRRFADMLEQGPLSGEELPVRGVDSAGLEVLLRFFYTGEVSLTYLNIVPVYDAAQRLDVPGVSRACKAFSSELIASTSTVCSMLQQALQFQLHETVAQCYESVRERFAEVIADDDFLSTSFTTLVRILMDNAEHAPKELVFQAAWRWGWSDLQHLQALPEILKVISVPDEAGLADLIKLEPAPVGQGPPCLDGGVDGGTAALMAQLRASVLQQVVQGTDFATAVQSVVDQHAAAVPPFAPPLLPGGGGLDGGDAGTGAVLALAAAPSTSSGGGGGSGGGAGGDLSGGVRPPLLGGGGEAIDPAVAAALASGAGLPPGLAGLSHGHNSYTAVMNQMQMLQQAILSGNMNALPMSILQGQQQEGGTPMSLLGLDPLGNFPHNMLPPQPQLQLPSSAGGLPGGYSLQAAMLSSPHLAQLFAASGAAPRGPEDVTAMRQFLAVAGGSSSHEAMAAASGDEGPQRGASRGSGRQHPSHDSAPLRGGNGSSGKSGGAKGVCQVDGCFADLAGLRDYHLRYKICEDHLKASSIVKDGLLQRFCQQCGRFHNLEEFDSDKRSCRARLHRHNERRRKRYLGENGGTPDNGAGDSDGGAGDSLGGGGGGGGMTKRSRGNAGNGGGGNHGGNGGGGGGGGGHHDLPLQQMTPTSMGVGGNPGGPLPSGSGGRGRAGAVLAGGGAGGGVNSSGLGGGVGHLNNNNPMGVLGGGGPGVPGIAPLNTLGNNSHAMFQALDVLANVAQAGAAQDEEQAAAAQEAAGRGGDTGYPGLDGLRGLGGDATTWTLQQQQQALLAYPQLLLAQQHNPLGGGMPSLLPPGDYGLQGGMGGMGDVQQQLQQQQVGGGDGGLGGAPLPLTLPPQGGDNGMPQYPGVGSMDVAAMFAIAQLMQPLKTEGSGGGGHLPDAPQQQQQQQQQQE